MNIIKKLLNIQLVGFILILLFISLLLFEDNSSDISNSNYLFIVMFGSVILMVYQFLKNKIGWRFQKSSHTTRPLSHNERAYLQYLITEESKKNSKKDTFTFFLIGLFMLIASFFLINTGIFFLRIIGIIIGNLSIILVIYPFIFLSQRVKIANLKKDLEGDISVVEGEFEEEFYRGVFSKNPEKLWDYKVFKYKFFYDMTNPNIVNLVKTYQAGDKVKVEFSPSSCYVWDILKT